VLHSPHIYPDNANAVMKTDLLHLLRREFALDWSGIHGAPHWARVRFNGLRMARDNGARLDVVECFALLHGSQRIQAGVNWRRDFDLASISDRD
jgi:HD superfamily phosphodiesterase